MRVAPALHHGLQIGQGAHAARSLDPHLAADRLAQQRHVLGGGAAAAKSRWTFSRKSAPARLASSAARTFSSLAQQARLENHFADGAPR